MSEYAEQIRTVRNEIATLKNARRVRAATLSSQEFAAMGQQIKAREAELRKLLRHFRRELEARG